MKPHLSTFAPHLLNSSREFLQLARRAALRDASVYVAVSYCWNRERSDWSPSDSDKPLQVICEDLSRRPSNAPSDVLYRSMAYAKAQNVNAIWIDQECIDQNDTVEKGDAIQQMDLAYQESDHPVAVLVFCFLTQIELDVFASICDLVLYTFDPSQIEVLESVLGALTDTDEKWFERAWTLQESVSAGDRVAHSDYRNQALACRVLATGQSADDCSILHCLGRRRGIWRLEGLNHQDYILD